MGLISPSLPPWGGANKFLIMFLPGCVEVQPGGGLIWGLKVIIKPWLKLWRNFDSHKKLITIIHRIRYILGVDGEVILCIPYSIEHWSFMTKNIFFTAKRKEQARKSQRNNISKLQRTKQLGRIHDRNTSLSKNIRI